MFGCYGTGEFKETKQQSNKDSTREGSSRGAGRYQLSHELNKKGSYKVYLQPKSSNAFDETDPASPPSDMFVEPPASK